MEQRWKDNNGKTEKLGEKPVVVLLRPPQTPHGTALSANLGLRNEKTTTNCLKNGNF
jgi:hypothetical protein